MQITPHAGDAEDDSVLSETGLVIMASMTTVEILFRYATPPTAQAGFALSGLREVYGIRHLEFDRAAHTLRVEYDATRLNAATVTRLLSQTGLEVVEEISPALAQPAATA